MITIIQTIYNKAVFFKSRIRGYFWSLFIKKIGRNFTLLDNCTLYSPSGISIGDNMFINFRVIIDGKGEVEIGKMFLLLRMFLFGLLIINFQKKMFQLRNKVLNSKKSPSEMMYGLEQDQLFYLV